MAIDVIEKQAKLLASDNRKAEPGIERIYWFPHEREVRLVETMAALPISDERRLRPYHFRANPDADLPAPSGVAMIRPEEFGKIELPPDWGNWDDAVLLEEDE